MAFSNIIVDDFGWVIQLTVKQDDVILNISTYTGKVFLLLDPLGEETSLTASFSTDGTDGKLSATVPAGRIDQVGNWKIRTRLTKSGVELTSEAIQFRVGSRK